MKSFFRTLLFGSFPSSGHITVTDIGLLILRVGMGASMALNHGFGKLANFSQLSGSFADPMGVGTTASLGMTVFAEFFCSILVALGIFARLAAIPLIIAMSVAAFIVLGDEPWSKKELAIVYLIPWLTIFFAGPGKLSLDYRMSRR